MARTYTVRAWLQLAAVNTSVTDGAQVTPSSESSTDSERIARLSGDGGRP